MVVMNKLKYKDNCIECGKSFQSNLITRKFCCKECTRISTNRNARRKRKK